VVGGGGDGGNIIAISCWRKGTVQKSIIAPFRGSFYFDLPYNFLGRLNDEAERKQKTDLSTARSTIDG